MSERRINPAPEQPEDQPEQDFAHIPAPESTYQFPNTPSYEAGGEPPHEGNPELHRDSTEEEPNREGFWKDPRNKFAKYILTTTTVLAVAGGSLLAGQKVFAGHNDDPNEGKRPVATGPANPGEVAPNNGGTPTEVAPTHEVGQRAFSSEMEYTPEGLEIALKDEDGNITEIVKGAEAYKSRRQLSTEKYPTAESAFPAIPGLFNDFVQFGHTQEERIAYKDYDSPEGPGKGVAGVRVDVFMPIFKEAVIAEADVPQANLHSPMDLIHGEFTNPDYNFFSLRKIEARMDDAIYENPDLQPKLVLDTEMWDGGIRLNPRGVTGNDENGYGAQLFLKTVGVGDETENITFRVDVTLLQSPDGEKWNIVAGYITPPDEFVGK